MKTSQFRSLIREEVKRVLKEASDDDFNYEELLGPVVGKAQKAFDKKYGWVVSKLADLPEMESFMNRYDSFENAEDVKNFNEGAIEYFTTFITKLKAINNKI